jgi:asparagine synthase (glutamine-hydrolysing)
MCGIAGCVMPSGAQPDRAALERMARLLAHRGPDDEGIEVDGPVGLVHRRLAIVDPSPAGAQPMRGDDGWWLTYNGEVFNHLALREELPGAWRGGSDTETVLRALERWGDDALRRFNGLFAFAAIDPRRRELLLVRDRLGVKPLYLARHAGGLWFASELRALLAAGVPARPRREVIRHAVVPGWVGGELTPLEGVDRLLPGTLMRVDLDTLEVRPRRWWRPRDLVDPGRAAELAALPRARQVDAAEEALRTSVRRRLMADVPVGTLCSGGIDSSLITSFAAEEQPGLVAVNASVVDQPDADEGPWARKVADRIGVELHTVEVTARSFRTGFVRTVEHHEYPLIHPGSVPMVELAALARANGVKVLLSGEGADELFGGYDWTSAPAVRLFGARRSPRRLPRALAAWARTRLRERRADGPPEALARYEAAVRADAGAAYAHHHGLRRHIERELAADLELYLIHLLTRQDKCTMASSVETRVPFLDPDVVALGLNLPLEARVEPQRKGILRDLARRIVGDDIADRPKIGFGFRTRAAIEDGADPAFLREGRLREVLETPEDEWRDGLAAMPEQWALPVWSAEVWCRLVLDGTPRDEVEDALWRAGAV